MRAADNQTDTGIIRFDVVHGADASGERSLPDAKKFGFCVA